MIYSTLKVEYRVIILRLVPVNINIICTSVNDDNEDKMWLSTLSVYYNTLPIRYLVNKSPLLDSAKDI